MTSEARAAYIENLISERKAKKSEAYRAWRVKNKEYHAERNRAYYHIDPTPTKLRTAAYSRATPAKARRASYNSELKKRFGITVDDRDAILAAQGGRCAVCGRTDPGGKYDWCVDHDHETNEIRGVLCGKCNKMLGFACDNVETLQAAVRYLRGNNHALQVLLVRAGAGCDGGLAPGDASVAQGKRRDLDTTAQAEELGCSHMARLGGPGSDPGK